MNEWILSHKISVSSTRNPFLVLSSKSRIGWIPKIEAKTAWLPSFRKSKESVYVLMTLAGEVAKTWSIFGITEILLVTGTVEGVVTPKRVDRIVFTFLNSGGWRDDSRDGTFEESMCFIGCQRVNVILCYVAELELWHLQIFHRVYC